MNISNKEVGKRIFDARKKMKLSRKELGLKVNLHESTVKRYEDGDIKTLDIEKMREFAKALDLDLGYLIDLDEDNPTLNNRDKKDIEKDLKKIMDDFKSGEAGPAFYDGVELDDDDLDKLEIAMRTALEIAKVKNKEKYTPKKYKKDKE